MIAPFSFICNSDYYLQNQSGLLHQYRVLVEYLSHSRNGETLSPGRGGGITSYIKVYGGVPQVRLCVLIFWYLSGHTFKILSILGGYHLPVVCICYGHKMRINGILGVRN